MQQETNFTEIIASFDISTLAHESLIETILESTTVTELPTTTSILTTHPKPTVDITMESWLQFFIKLVLSFSYYVLKSLFILFKIPLQLLSYTTYTASVTFDTYTLIGGFSILSTLLYLFIRYRLLNKYARLPTAGLKESAPFDLQPNAEEKTEDQGYPDEFMNAFLSSIKVFGYLDKKVFHELARHLQTRKLKAGEILIQSEDDEKDFYVVVDGKVQVFVKGQTATELDKLDGLVEWQSEDLKDKVNFKDWEGHHLLNEVCNGGTVSSLFAILSVFTEDLEIPKSFSSREKVSMKEAAIEPNLNSMNDASSPMKTSVDASKEESNVEPKKEPQGNPKPEANSVHPDIIARAAVDTTLAVIPAKAFKNLTLKYPFAASHIVQVILARFQRVTFSTLYRYLGLSRELLKIEKTVNEMTGYGLPPEMFDSDAIDRLRYYLTCEAGKKYEHGTPMRHEFKSMSQSRSKRNPFIRKRSQMDSHLPATLESYESEMDATQSELISENEGVGGAFSHLLNEADDDQEQIKEAIYDCIVQMIGAVPSIDIPVEDSGSGTSIYAGLNSSRKSSTPTEQAAFPKLVRKSSSRASVTFPYLKRSFEDESNTEKISPVSSLDNLSSMSDRMSEIKLLYFPRGSILVNEGERVEGLYFVIDGILEAGIRSMIGPMGQTNASHRPGKKRTLFFIPPGGLAGYLAAITGHLSFVTIQAKTDCCVGFMTKQSLDLHVEKYPNILLCLAKRLVMHLSPLVLHIDVALEWGQINAGQILCKQGDESNSIYIVLTGRLRSIANKTKADGKTKFEILGEFGQGESVGEMEVLTNTQRPGTIHAIRDTEIAIMPSTLFNALAIRHPEITIAIARIIATRSSAKINFPDTKAFGSVLESGNANDNLRTVAILPVNGMVPINEFSVKLREALLLIGASVALLNTASVTSQLGKHAFTRIGRLKLLSWLSEQEESHRLVLYVADGGVNAPWTQRCVRQADCILLVGLGDEDPAIGEFEHLLIGMKITARKELVLLHSERFCVPGSTAQWLQNRLWIHAHHHVQMPLGTTKILTNKSRKSTFVNIQNQFSKYYSSLESSYGLKTSSPTIYTGIRSDFARIARRLLSKSIGLVLGGGGARGIAHIGIIRALEDAGIPIDMVGGTSIGSFVGGMYARENDHVSVFGRGKMFAGKMSSKWRQIMDLTYPVTSMFTGHAFNRAIWKIFLDTQIEDLWLPYFAVTTNITWSRMEIHRSGYMWRYIRASMSLSGYLPPLCDKGNMLLDGGYLNNLPADIMRSMGARTIVAIDVGRVDDTSPVNYGDALSGWWVLLNRLNPFGYKYGKIPQMADIQSRLAYVSSVKQLEDVKALDGVYYVHPDVHHFGTLEFEKFSEIFDVGHRTGLGLIQKWRADGSLERDFGIESNSNQPLPGKHSRRASI